MVFGFGKKKSTPKKPVDKPTDQPPAVDAPSVTDQPPAVDAPSVTDLPPCQPEKTEVVTDNSSPVTEPKSPATKKGWWKRLKQGLSKSSQQLGDGLANTLIGKRQLDAGTLEELETLLLTADVGIETTDYIIQTLKDNLSRREIDDPHAIYQQLTHILEDILKPCEQALDVNQAKPFVILMVGVNGAGKTTSIAKLAQHYQSQGKKLLLAAGDTFRAAAVEQLKTWGERHDVPVIAQGTGADSASVIFDAYHASGARDVDILLADTAGRLHTQEHLMRELAKIKRVMQKINPEAPHETLLILDASQGQNALQQAKQFHDAIGLTGLCLTKLDGTAKGGIVFAIARECRLPIRFIGVGEKATDLQAFHCDTFIQALLKPEDAPPHD